MTPSLTFPLNFPQEQLAKQTIAFRDNSPSWPKRRGRRGGAARPTGRKDSLQPRQREERSHFERLKRYCESKGDKPKRIRQKHTHRTRQKPQHLGPTRHCTTAFLIKRELLISPFQNVRRRNYKLLSNLKFQRVRGTL